MLDEDEERIEREFRVKVVVYAALGLMALIWAGAKILGVSTP